MLWVDEPKTSPDLFYTVLFVYTAHVGTNLVVDSGYVVDTLTNGIDIQHRATYH